MKIQAELEIARRRRRQEIVLHVVLAEVRLRIRTGVRRPDVQVTSGERQRRIAGAQARCDALRNGERRADFAQAPELAVLEVAGVGALEARRDVPGLLVER